MMHPSSADPRDALRPDPTGCTGWRLWRMTEARTGATPTDYMRAFHRYNLIVGTRWDPKLARRAWEHRFGDLSRYFETVVLLGSAVQSAASLDLPPVFVSRSLVCIPHPSGLNRWYNSETNRQIVEIIMEELYCEAVAG